MNYFSLIEELGSIYDQFDGYVVSFEDIIEAIDNVIPWSEVYVTGVSSIGLMDGEYKISGAYSPSADSDGVSPIELELLLYRRMGYYFGDDGYFDRCGWIELCANLASTIGHEFIHAHQHRRRNFKRCREFKGKTDIETYLGKSDEVEAYAFTAAADMIFAGMISNKVKPLTDTNVYNFYVDTFESTHPVVIKFEKLSHKYFERLRRQYVKFING